MPNCPAGLDEDPQHLALRIEARRRLGVGQIRAMAKVDIEAFWGKEVTRVYIAGKLGEAKQVESTLTENGIDYAVEVEPFVTLILGILPSEYAGAGFYVLSEQAALARSILLAAGFTAGIEVDCRGRKEAGKKCQRPEGQRQCRPANARAIAGMVFRMTEMPAAQELRLGLPLRR